MKKLINFLIILAVLAGVLLLAKNLIAKAAVENGVKLVTGLPLKMDKLDVSLTKSYIGIEKLELQNPKGFAEKTMLDMPEIYIDYHLGDILGGNIHMEEIRIHMEKFVVVKNADGTLNLDSLKALQGESKEGEAKKPAEKKGEAPKIQLDVLKLSLGSVYYKDYSKNADNPSVKEFKLGIQEEYKDITDPNTLIRLIVLKVMMNTPLASLTGFDLGPLQDGLGNVLASGTKITGELFDTGSAAAKEAMSKGTEALKDIADTDLGDAGKKLTEGVSGTTKELTSDLEGAAKNLTSDLKEKTGALTESLKLPFGKKEE